MNIDKLIEIRNNYHSYEGTGNNRANKNDVAMNEFKSVLDTALNLAQEVKDLKSELRKKPVEHEHVKFTRQEELENQTLYCNEEPDDMKQAADFARYG